MTDESVPAPALETFFRLALSPDEPLPSTLPTAASASASASASSLPPNFPMRPAQQPRRARAVATLERSAKSAKGGAPLPNPAKRPPT